MNRPIERQHENPTVEYWINRALDAEEALDKERKEMIASNPVVKEHYEKTHEALFGYSPFEDSPEYHESFA
jgi:hypothetical protein